MEFVDGEKPLNTIRKLDMVAWLASLGYEPASIKKGYEYWYLSPLREESTASFKVNQRLNAWYDFGLMLGGNLVDLGMRYFGCTAGELIGHFRGDVVLPARLPGVREVATEEPKLLIKKVRPLYAYPLKSYLHSRGIPVSIAEAYCHEVKYMVNGHELYGIGFKNDAGGYEIRSAIAKCSSAPKDITTLRFGAASVQIFEGFFDFLSWRTLHPFEDPRATDIVVLNGAGMFGRAIPFLQEHERLHIWSDNDAAGAGYLQQAKTLGRQVVDESGLYAGFNDLNQWLCHKGEPPEKRQRLKIGY